MEKKERGARGEEAAAQHLAQNGYAILARNYRVRWGEIDIVAEKDGMLCFVEVKTRASDRFGEPREAVGHRKRQHLRLAAESYLAEHPWEGPMRFDVIEVIWAGRNWVCKAIENAFDASGTEEGNG